MADIAAGVPFHVLVAHPGATADGIRLRVNTVPPITMEAPIIDGQATFPFAGGLEAGTYALDARAYNEAGESTPVVEPLVITEGVPTSPTSVTVQANPGQTIPVTITVG